MKKILIAAIVASAGLMFFETSNAVPMYAGGQPLICKTAIDTVPAKRKDTSWNRKKYPDTTQMPKRDTARMH